MYSTRFFKEEPQLAIIFIFAFIYCLIAKYYVFASIIGTVCLCLILFYREPIFKLPFYKIQSNEIVSPTYGTVKRIMHNPITKKIVISVFLSPLDIHTQYYPIHGIVLEQIHDSTGKFELAYEIDKSNDNEKVITVMKNLNYEHSERLVKITQIAGYLVRRISTPFKVDQTVHAGDYLGMIKFGSRVDIEFDDIYCPRVQVGQYVYGPHTLIASAHCF